MMTFSSLLTEAVDRSKIIRPQDMLFLGDLGRERYQFENDLLDRSIEEVKTKMHDIVKGKINKDIKFDFGMGSASIEIPLRSGIVLEIFSDQIHTSSPMYLANIKQYDWVINLQRLLSEFEAVNNI